VTKRRSGRACAPALAGISAALVAPLVLAGPAAPHEQALDRIDAVGPYVDACVVPALRQQGFGGRDVTMRFAFRRDGAIIGEPTVTYSSPPQTEPEQMRFIAAVRSALQACAPLPFSKRFGAVIAGKIFTFRYTLTTEKDRHP
jgi:hypothetical protein